ncbi:NAD-dependent epimerase/dehydratase family protein [Clavibacter michiganensis]|uniref:NAD-dependent epimerase/dehydratase family protein n=1 Tax=Clavibacter michiganensis TaxID=28447 RepID=UPI0026DC8711|nr:NAD-dependent epimerase/dehydratase family protein [Clavibacter michiganensis]MDO4075804.1 NAD-dependent epimerase/dehydratase family protein [Clavibacter michiganensis]
MIVLVTGASGMLGRAVAERLASAGHAVRTFQRQPSGLSTSGAEPVPGAVVDHRGSVTDPAAVARAVDGVDAVVHLAAKVSLAGDSDDFRAVNVEGTRGLLRAARAAGVTRFVHVSSPSVAHTGLSITGDGAGPADPVRARGDYARTKAEGELIALAADDPAMRVLAVRPHLVWGPGDTQLVARIVDRAARGRLPLLGHGAALIDTVYRDNAADAIVAALAAADTAHGHAYVVTNGEPRPVAELLAGMCRAAGVPAPRIRVPAALARAAGGAVERVWAVRPGSDEPPMTRFLAEQLSTAHWFDQRETRRALGWTPAVSLDEGFERLRLSYVAAR